MRQSSKYQLFKSSVSLKHPKCLSKFKVSLKYKNVSKRFKVFQLWAPYTKVTTTTKSKTTILFWGGSNKGTTRLNQVFWAPPKGLGCYWLFSEAHSLSLSLRPASFHTHCCHQWPPVGTGISKWWGLLLQLVCTLIASPSLLLTSLHPYHREPELSCSPWLHCIFKASPTRVILTLPTIAASMRFSLSFHWTTTSIYWPWANTPRFMVLSDAGLFLVTGNFLAPTG